MEPKYPPLIPPATMTTLKGLIRQGYATAQEFADPQLTVMIRRHDHSLGRYADLHEVRLIGLTVGIREGVSELGTPIEERDSYGTLTCWGDEYEPAVKDRFTHEAQVYEVTTVYPPRFGVVTAEVSLKQITPQ